VQDILRTAIKQRQCVSVAAEGIHITKLRCAMTVKVEMPPSAAWRGIATGWRFVELHGRHVGEAIDVAIGRTTVRD
jgi:hypothetical protein